MHPARSTLIRGDGGEALKILQLLSSRVELKNIFVCCYAFGHINIDLVDGGEASKILQLLSSRVERKKTVFFVASVAPQH